VSHKSVGQRPIEHGPTHLSVLISLSTTHLSYVALSYYVSALKFRTLTHISVHKLCTTYLSYQTLHLYICISVYLSYIYLSYIPVMYN